MANPITSSGLASGIDTASLIAQLVQLQRAPISKLQTTQSNLSNKASKLADLSSKLSALSNAAESLNSLQKFLVTGATTSDADIVTASTTGDATESSYALNISSLATAEKDRSSGYSSASSTVTAGTLTLTVDGTSTPIELTDSDTLANVVSKINGADAGVNATLVNDGLGTATSYRIILTARNSGFDTALGASSSIVIDSDTTGLGFTEIVTATNAEFTMDGQPETYSRRTNSFSDLISGVTFQLANTGNATVKIARDDEAVVEQVSAFVSAYNDLMTSLNKELKVSKDTKRATSLASESYVGTLRRELASLVTADAGDTGGAYSSLAGIGITQSKTGMLQLDDAKFEAALASNAESVANVFANSTMGISARLDELDTRYTDSLEGLFTIGAKGLASMKTNINDRIDALERRATSYEDRLRAQFTAMEQTIASIQAQGQRFTAIIG